MLSCRAKALAEPLSGTKKYVYFYRMIGYNVKARAAAILAGGFSLVQCRDICRII